MMFASVSGNNSLVITARKRSFGHGNVFTPVCHSVQGVGRAFAHPLDADRHKVCYGLQRKEKLL